MDATAIIKDLFSKDRYAAALAQYCEGGNLPSDRRQS